jgi:hypothetical protein
MTRRLLPVLGFEPLAGRKFFVAALADEPQDPENDQIDGNDVIQQPGHHKNENTGENGKYFLDFDMKGHMCASSGFDSPPCGMEKRLDI